jgi:ubiquinone/menaquinone biosynthesis C-methylase UbiE
MEHNNSQPEVWSNHTSSMTVEGVVEEYTNPAVVHRELVSYIEKLAPPRGQKVIEIGSETGVTSMLLSDSYDKTILDRNPVAIELAKKAQTQLNRRLTCIVGDMFAMPFQNESFDIVFNAGVLGHFDTEDRVRALKEYARILKKGGQLFIGVTNHYSYPYRIAYLLRSFKKKWPWPKEFRIYNLEKEFEASNLKLLSRATLSQASVLNWVSFSRLLRMIISFWSRLYAFEGYLTILHAKKEAFQ